MTHRERAAAALTLQVPDHVPTFELEFQLAEEMFGKLLLPPELEPGNIEKLSSLERERKICEMAEYTAYVYRELDYSIIPLMMIGDFDYWQAQGKLPPEFELYARYVRAFTEGKVLLAHHGDGTYSIPDGNDMYAFAYRIADDPEGVCAQAQRMADAAIERNKRLHEAGIDALLLCSDYCYNSGPFLSPAMFRQFIQPYLYRIIQAGRADGQFTIKHTDGNIMPILDQLVECGPHALHSLDPMAGVDIREVKRLVGDKVCLCGNVHCAALQKIETVYERTMREVYDIVRGVNEGGSCVDWLSTWAPGFTRRMPTQPGLDVWDTGVNAALCFFACILAEERL